MKKLLSITVILLALFSAALFGAREKPCEHQNVLAVKGHPATCTEDGLTDGSYCADCGDIITEQKVIPAFGHTAGDWIVDKEATCTEAGSKHKECEICGELLETEEIPVTEHNYVANVIAPEGYTIGYTLHKCTECGDTYCDSYDYSLYGGLTFSNYTNRYAMGNDWICAEFTIEIALQLDSSVTDRGGVLLGNYYSNDEDSINIEIYAEGRPRVFIVNDGNVSDYLFSADVRSEDVVNIAFAYRRNKAYSHSICQRRRRRHIYRCCG